MGCRGVQRADNQRQGLVLPRDVFLKSQDRSAMHSRIATGEPDSQVTYWLWRFDRKDDPIPLDNFWNKTMEQCVADLDLAGNPTAGHPDGPADVEMAVDPYF